MRCKSCDAELSESDLQRKDPVDGSFTDLCKVCYGVSEHHRYQLGVAWDEAHEDVEEAVEDLNPSDVFEAFVQRHNLMESWAEGLGMKWTPQRRQMHFYDKAWADFQRLKEQGFTTLQSLERACNVHRANRRHEHSGASYASMYVEDYHGGELDLTGG